jgi:hypothetical protein
MKMKRLICAAVLALTGLPVFAQSTPADDIIAALRSHGYRIVVQERTWLGRERVVAENANKRREVVFNPGTGEIMRDYVVALAQGDSNTPSQTSVGVAADTPVAKDGPLGTEVSPTLGVTGDQGSLVGDPVADPVTGVSP